MTGLQRHLDVGTLVSNQERRAAVVPQINRGYNGYQLVVSRTFCSAIDLHRISFVRASRDTPRRAAFDCLGVKGSVVSWADRPVGVPSCPFPPRSAAPPCAALSRPARDMSGFGIRQVFKAAALEFNSDNIRNTAAVAGITNQCSRTCLV